MPKIIVLHGLNNNDTTWDEFEQKLRQEGFTDIVRLTLPGHGKTRDEGRDFETLLEKFHQTIWPHVQKDYSVIAYSLGALFFQNWLLGRTENLPTRQVLLAPALYLKNEKIIRKIMHSLHPDLPIPSIAPREIKLHPSLYVWEYRNLLAGVHRFQQSSEEIRVPTKIILDGKDELVDARELKNRWHKKNNGEVIILNRKPLYWGPTFHHILFHSKYFPLSDWDFLHKEIYDFLNPI